MPNWRWLPERRASARGAAGGGGLRAVRRRALRARTRCLLCGPVGGRGQGWPRLHRARAWGRSEEHLGPPYTGRRLGVLTAPRTTAGRWPPLVVRGAVQRPHILHALRARAPGYFPGRAPGRLSCFMRAATVAAGPHQQRVRLGGRGAQARGWMPEPPPFLRRARGCSSPQRLGMRAPFIAHGRANNALSWGGDHQHQESARGQGGGRLRRQRAREARAAAGHSRARQRAGSHRP